jgi:hypothetical protein
MLRGESVNQRFRRAEEWSRQHDARDGKDGASADRKNHESVFRVAAVLRRVVPTIEHFHDGADKADQQDDRGGDSEDARPHSCSLARDEVLAARALEEKTDPSFAPLPAQERGQR